MDEWDNNREHPNFMQLLYLSKNRTNPSPKLEHVEFFQRLLRQSCMVRYFSIEYAELILMMLQYFELLIIYLCMVYTKKTKLFFQSYINTKTCKLSLNIHIFSMKFRNIGSILMNLPIERGMLKFV